MNGQQSAISYSEARRMSEAPWVWRLFELQVKLWTIFNFHNFPSLSKSSQVSEVQRQLAAASAVALRANLRQHLHGRCCKTLRGASETGSLHRSPRAAHGLSMIRHFIHFILPMFYLIFAKWNFSGWESRTRFKRRILTSSKSSKPLWSARRSMCLSPPLWTPRVWPFSLVYHRRSTMCHFRESVEKASESLATPPHWKGLVSTEKSFSIVDWKAFSRTHFFSVASFTPVPKWKIVWVLQTKQSS